MVSWQGPPAPPSSSPPVGPSWATAAGPPPARLSRAHSPSRRPPRRTKGSAGQHGGSTTPSGFSLPAKARTACTEKAVITPPLPGWRRGWRQTSSTSTAPPPLRRAGSVALIACSTRSSQGPTTAGSRSTRATSPSSRATPRELRPCQPRRRPRAAVRCLRSGDARPGPRGVRTRRLSRCSRRNAVPRRGDDDRPGGRGDDPDLERVDVLHARLRLHVRPRLRASLRVVRSDRRLRRALRQSVHARVLQDGVRNDRSLAGQVARGRADAGGRARRLHTVAACVDARASDRARGSQEAARQGG